MGAAVRKKRQRPQQQQTDSIGLPAPIEGIVATGIFGVGSAAAEGDIGVKSAIWLYNFIAGEYGTRVRPGSREFATSIPDLAGADGVVRTVMLYNSVVAGGANDVLFAATDLGIFDITAGGAGPWDLVPATALTWPNQGNDAGWVSFINYTNVAGDHFLLIADEDNGYYIFDGTTWAAGTFTGAPVPLAVNLVQISEWNGRIWLVEKNSARAWFLDPLALTGQIEPMDVGSRFKEGGHLVQCATWTLDAGDGMDDKFVMISAAGDVLIWVGTDPTTAADLALEGRWTVGAVPEGRRVLSDWGGDVAILSTGGVITASALLAGRASLDSSQFLSKNINQYIRSEMEDSLDVFGWSMQLVPTQNITIISVPQPPLTSRPPIQFVLETSTNAWSMFRDLDMVCIAEQGNAFVFGTSGGRVMVLEGTTDDILLDGSSAKAITFSLLTHYSGMGQAAQWKLAQFIRPYWIGAAQPVFNVQVHFDFDLAELLISPPFVESDAATWDSAIWDTALWAGTAQAYLETIGVGGMGRHVAVAIRGEATNELTYVGADLMVSKGGLL